MHSASRAGLEVRQPLEVEIQPPCPGLTGEPAGYFQMQFRPNAGEHRVETGAVHG
jgi:hypothetical protein